jgi:hypothetical protein
MEQELFFDTRANKRINLLSNLGLIGLVLVVATIARVSSPAFLPNLR